MLDEAIRIVGLTLLGAGTFFCVLGVYGVMRLPDLYNRLHAAGMVMTMGAGCVFLSLLFVGAPQAGLKGVVTAAFLALTAPMVTHVLARTAYHQGVPLAEETLRDELANEEGRMMNDE
jgi:multicomponent Na+:H+ antiporter subunit G